MGMIRDKATLLQGLALEALRRGADAIEVEYKDGCEQVFAVRDGVGYGIARLDTSSDQAASLRKELYGLTKKRRRIASGDVEFELRVRVCGSFGEDAFRVEMRRI